MSKTKQTPEVKEQAENVVEKNFSITKDFLGAVVNVLKTKPFAAVANVMPLLSKEVMTESEVNSILNILGQLPYEEVAGVFAIVPQHIKLVEETEK